MVSRQKYGGQVDIHVSDETQRAASNCKKEFSCLKRKRKDLCTVKHCVNEEVHFIKCLNDGYCFYQLPFGSSFFVVALCGKKFSISTKYKWPRLTTPSTMMFRAAGLFRHVASDHILRFTIR
jgi:hypothetical protein